jgi:hypothetical protein
MPPATGEEQRQTLRRGFGPGCKRKQCRATKHAPTASGRDADAAVFEISPARATRTTVVLVKISVSYASQRRIRRSAEQPGPPSPLGRLQRRGSVGDEVLGVDRGVSAAPLSSWQAQRSRRIFIAAVTIAGFAIDRLLHPAPIEHAGIGLLVVDARLRD